MSSLPCLESSAVLNEIDPTLDRSDGSEMMPMAYSRSENAQGSVEHTAKTRTRTAQRDDGGVTEHRIRIQSAMWGHQQKFCDLRVSRESDRTCLILRDGILHKRSDLEAMRCDCILEQTPMEVCVLTRDGVMDYVNTAAAVGRSIRELQGKHFRVIDPEFHCADKSDLVHGVDSVGVYRSQTECMHVSGRPQPKEVDVTPFLLEHDEFLCIAAYDCTLDASSEYALHQSLDHFLRWADHAGDLICSHRLYPEKGFACVNPAATAMTGYSPEEQYAGPDLGRNSSHPEDAPKLATLLQESATEEPSQLRWVKKDGTVIWTEQINRLVRDESGGLVGIEGIAREMTRRKQSEEEIRQANSRLEALVEARTRDINNAKRELETVLYSVAHDLRAPLRHIEGYLGLLRAELADAADAHAALTYLDTLERTASRLSGHFDALLSFSRIGQQEMRHTTISMTALVDEVKHQLDAALSPDAVEWRIGSLPPVCGDPGMILSVVSNLLGNAVKFSRDRTPARIGIEGCSEGAMNRYRVSDNGEGFDMQYANRLFNLFQRLHTREEYEGHGIGLALVHRIVSLHGGEITAEATPRLGAVFTFTLPAANTAVNSNDDDRQERVPKNA
jgi:PAS domain S-box-containing protein